MAVKTLGDILLGNAAVTAIVGDRVYPLVRPQNIVTPAVTLQRIANVPQNHLRGFGNLDANRVQVDCFADTYLQARALSAACRTAINAAGHTCELELDEYDEQVLVYRVILDFNVWL